MNRFNPTLYWCLPENDPCLLPPRPHIVAAFKVVYPVAQRLEKAQKKNECGTTSVPFVAQSAPLSCLFYACALLCAVENQSRHESYFLTLFVMKISHVRVSPLYSTFRVAEIARLPYRDRTSGLRARYTATHTCPATDTTFARVPHS